MVRQEGRGAGRSQTKGEVEKWSPGHPQGGVGQTEAGREAEGRGASPAVKLQLSREGKSDGMAGWGVVP